MKKTLNNRTIVGLLAILFMAPGISAYLFYHHPNWLASSKTNKGTLFNPPILLNSLGKQTKWQLILWSSNDCEESCLKQLDQLARIRLALGRKLYQVDQRLLLKQENAQKISDHLQFILKAQDLQISAISKDEFALLKASHKSIFIANPDNLLILGYKKESDSNDIYKDLKHLLSLAEQKNG